MMLNHDLPGRLRRGIGISSFLALGLGMTAGVYAAGQPPAQVRAASTANPPDPGSVYQLAMVLTRDGKTIATPVVCVKPGAAARIEQSGGEDASSRHLRLDLMATPRAHRRITVSLQGSASQASDTAKFDRTWTGPLGKPMTLRAHTDHGAAPMQISITPSQGCAAAPRPPAPPAAPASPAVPAPPAAPAPPAPPASSAPPAQLVLIPPMIPGSAPKPPHSTEPPPGH